MKSILLLTTITFLTLFGHLAFAQHDLGAGITLGNPTGITGKYKIAERAAWDAALGLSSGDIYLHASWLKIMPEAFKIDRYPIQWYFGIGGRLINHEDSHRHNNRDYQDHTHLGVRVLGGLRMQFSDPRIELYVEVSLTLEVAPEADFDFDGGIGARYYF